MTRCKNCSRVSTSLHGPRAQSRSSPGSQSIPIWSCSSLYGPPTGRGHRAAHQARRHLATPNESRRTQSRSQSDHDRHTVHAREADSALPVFFGPVIEHLVATRPRDALLFGDGDHFIRRAKSTTGWFNSAVMQVRGETQERIEAATAAGLRPPHPFPRVAPHDLRHTAASLAISAGANVKAVQRMLGHASAAMTLDTYADLFDDDLDNVADALARAADASGVGDVLASSESGVRARSRRAASAGDSTTGYLGRALTIRYHGRGAAWRTSKRPESDVRSVAILLPRGGSWWIQHLNVPKKQGFRRYFRGGPRGARTHDPRIKSPMLYRLS